MSGGIQPKRRNGKNDTGDDQAPGNFERNVRGGCGCLFGLLVPLTIGFRFFRHSSMAGVIAGAILFAILCAYLAIRYGDAFWDSFGNR